MKEGGGKLYIYIAQLADIAQALGPVSGPDTSVAAKAIIIFEELLVLYNNMLGLI